MGKHKSYPSPFVSEKDKVLFADIIEQIEFAKEERKYSNTKIASRCYMTNSTVGNVLKGKCGTIRSFLRVIDALDYDLNLVKRSKISKIDDVEAASAETIKLMKYNAAAKRKERDGKYNFDQQKAQTEFDQDFLNNT